jgi:hypothetical protein
MGNFSSDFSRGFDQGFGLGFLGSNKIVGNPFLWLKFDSSSGTVAIDSSGNARNQVVGGTVTSFWVAGKNGNCGNFVTANSNSIAMPASYFPQSGTFCCWVNADFSSMVATGSRLISTKDSLGPNHEHRTFWAVSSSSFRFYVNNSGTSTISSIGDLRAYDNEWVHIGWKWEYGGANTEIMGFVNGENIIGSNQTLTGAVNIPDINFEIANWYGQFFSGKIDDFLLYHSALSNAEIRSIYNLQK